MSDDLRSGLREIAAAVAAEGATLRSEIHEVKHDIASVRARVEECRTENMAFFDSFMGSIEATQAGVDVLRNYQLEAAEMSLKEFQATGGDLDELKEASKNARTALLTGKTLDIKMSAAIINISAGYVYRSKTDSPIAAKQSTVRGTLANVVKHFAPTWADPPRAATQDGRKVLAFLINLVSCVSVLPPENVPVFPELDSRLLPAFSQLCVTQPDLRQMYPAVAGVAAKVMLEGKTLKGLVQLADEVDVDIENCTSKDHVVQALLTSVTSLEPGPATGDRAALESQSLLDLCLLAQQYGVDMGRCKSEAIRSILGWEKGLKVRVPSSVNPGKGLEPRIPSSVHSGKGLEPRAPSSEKGPGPRRDSATDRAALAGLFQATNGRAWTNNAGWGTSTPLSKWHGVEVNVEGRVAQLRLGRNNLRGRVPSVLGQLTALQELILYGNHLSGPIPPALGELSALEYLDLGSNGLFGPIPMALGGLTALRKIGLSRNQLHNRSEGDITRMLPDCVEVFFPHK
ncbi:unnamed protein product [Ectocarpus sp. 4 AP-2014]